MKRDRFYCAYTIRKKRLEQSVFGQYSASDRLSYSHCLVETTVDGNTLNFLATQTFQSSLRATHDEPVELPNVLMYC
jgi:hypothetical protein